VRGAHAGGRELGITLRNLVMGWIYLESLVALAIAVGIVWWTFAPVRRRRKEERSRAARDRDSAER